MYNEYLSKFINWRQGGDKPKSVTQVFLLYKSLGAMLKLLPIPIYQCSLNRKTFFGVYYVFNIWHFKCPPPDARYRSEKIAPTDQFYLVCPD